LNEKKTKASSASQLSMIDLAQKWGGECLINAGKIFAIGLGTEICNLQHSCPQTSSAV
jgi:hypothetical protein